MVMEPTISERFPIDCTILPHLRAPSAERFTGDLRGLADLLAAEGVIWREGRDWSCKETYDADKARQRMLIFAVLGNNASSGGSLKHDANVRAITGCMLDVDPSKLPSGTAAPTLEQVVERLRDRGIHALVRQSTGDPSRGKPYHVLVPFSQPRSGSDWRAMLQWMNHEILNGGSDAGAQNLSQGFFCGRMQGRNDTAEPVVVEGAFIDRLLGEEEVRRLAEVTPPIRTLADREAAKIPVIELDQPRNVERGKAWLRGDARDQFEFGGNRFRVACELKDIGLSEATILDLLCEDWGCEADVEGTEFRVRNAYAFGKSPPGIADPAADFAPSADLDEDVPTPPPAERAAKAEGGRVRGTIVYMDKDLPYEPEPELIRDTVPSVGVGFLGGQSGVYKSFVAIDITVSVTTGQPFAGRKIEDRGAVLYFAFEGGSTIRGRVKARRSRLDDPSAELPIGVIDDFRQIRTDQDYLDFDATITHRAAAMKERFGVPARMVVVDTVTAGQMLPEDMENDPAAWQRVFSKLTAIAKRHNLVIMVVHHAGKNAAAGLRGSSAARAAADFNLMLSCERNHQTGESGQRTLALEKSRDGAEGPIATVDRVVVQIGARADGSPVTTLVMEYGPISREASTDREGRPVRAAKEAYRQVVEDLGTDTVPAEDVREAFDELYQARGKNPREACRKAFDRAKRFFEVTVDRGVEYMTLMATPYAPSASDEFDEIAADDERTFGQARTNPDVRTAPNPGPQAGGLSPRRGGTPDKRTFPKGVRSNCPGSDKFTAGAANFTVSVPTPDNDDKLLAEAVAMLK